MQVHVKATDTAPAYSYKSTEIHKFLVRWCFFAAGLTPTYVIAWYIMHVSICFTRCTFFLCFTRFSVNNTAEQVPRLACA